MKKKRGCLMWGFILMGLLLMSSFIMAINRENENNIISNHEVTPIFNANEYGKITSNELVQKMGEPSTKEDWVNKTASGEFSVTTYEYDKDGIHYEFIIADDKVVRITLYSNKYWNDEGYFFTYEKKLDMLHLFGITEFSDDFKIADNSASYRIRPVSDTIEDFWIPDMDSKNKTFGLVKITYDMNYFN
ncbi:hypothetical protein [Acetoanaerobium noterae]|uniref:hypothetical protein n=1 Tax=Acetoanaerobium noterae TaxID=745369 RepID=UPI00333ECEDB